MNVVEVDVALVREEDGIFVAARVYLVVDDDFGVAISATLEPLI